MKLELWFGTVLVTAVTLAACHGAMPFVPSAGLQPSAARVADGSAVTGKGVLVSYVKGAPIAGVPVGLASWSPGAKPVPQGKTKRDGSFVVHANAPGKYLLFIGADQGQGGASAVISRDGRPTIHDAIELSAGVQTLVAPKMPNVPTIRYPKSNFSGKYRLAHLTTMEKSCVAFENKTRGKHGYDPAVADEWLFENNRALWKWDTRTNEGHAGHAVTGYGDDGGEGADCTIMIEATYKYHGAIAVGALKWYAGDAGGPHHVSVDSGMFDPRGPLPTPTWSPWP